MTKRTYAIAIAAAMLGSSAHAANCGAYTYTITNGTIADATQVMSNFNTILNCANNNLAPLASPSFTGNVGIGTTSPSQPLSVSGNASVTGQFLGNASDTVSAPSFSWSTDATTGLYHPATNTIGFVINGAEEARISPAGEFSINTTGTTALFRLGGTYGSTSNVYLERIDATLNSSNTSTIYGISNAPSFNPSGGSISSIYGVYNAPSVSSSYSGGVTNLYGVRSSPSTATSYAGTVTTAYSFYGDPNTLGTNPFGTYIAYYAASNANGNNIATGTVTNYGFRIGNLTASAASGGTVKNYAYTSVVPSGNNAGTSNYGFYMTGAGGTTSATNYSLYNASTATSYFAGTVGIGTTTPSGLLFVNGTAGGTTAWAGPSDARLKTAVVPLTGALDMIARLRAVRYTWRKPEDRPVGKALALPVGKPDVGFIAQEVAAVVPEAVDAPKDPSTDIYSLKDTKLIPVLVEALKEQQAEIVQLRASLAALQGAGRH